MKIVPMEDNKMFTLTELSFAELKAIKDSCALSGQKGSTTAKALHLEMEKLMEEITI